MSAPTCKPPASVAATQHGKRKHDRGACGTLSESDNAAIDGLADGLADKIMGSLHTDSSDDEAESAAKSYGHTRHSHKRKKLSSAFIDADSLAVCSWSAVHAAHPLVVGDGDDDNDDNDDNDDDVIPRNPTTNPRVQNALSYGSIKTEESAPPDILPASSSGTDKTRIHYGIESVIRNDSLEVRPETSATSTSSNPNSTLRTATSLRSIDAEDSKTPIGFSSHSSSDTNGNYQTQHAPFRANNTMDKKSDNSVSDVGCTSSSLSGDGDAKADNVQGNRIERKRIVDTSESSDIDIEDGSSNTPRDRTSEWTNSSRDLVLGGSDDDHRSKEIHIDYSSSSEEVEEEESSYDTDHEAYEYSPSSALSESGDGEWVKMKSSSPKMKRKRRSVHAKKMLAPHRPANRHNPKVSDSVIEETRNLVDSEEDDWQDSKKSSSSRSKERQSMKLNKESVSRRSAKLSESVKEDGARQTRASKQDSKSQRLQRKQIKSLLSNEQLNESTKDAQQIEKDRLARLLERRNRKMKDEIAIAEGDIYATDTKSSNEIIGGTLVPEAPDRSNIESHSSSDTSDSENWSSTDATSEYSSEETEFSDFDDDMWELECDLYNKDFFSDDNSSTVDEKLVEKAVYQATINNLAPDGEEPIKVPQRVAKCIKAHQLEGIRFMWSNIVETIGHYEKNQKGGFGCLLAHAMGLGKSLQTITFLWAFLKHTSARRALLIVPVNTIMNWHREFARWLSMGQRPPVRVFESLKQSREGLELWINYGGCLLIGYESFRSLTASNKIASSYLKVLLDSDIVVCDEGHRIKNSSSGIAHALKKITTKRRICLTGSPLQNNLIEYWSMIDFIRPNLLGTKAEFSNRFANPIRNGSCMNSTPIDVKKARFRAHVLHDILKGFVHRRTHSIFKSQLPKKHEYVLQCPLTPLQERLYTRFICRIERENVLSYFAVFSKIWNHPYVLRQTVRDALQSFMQDPSKGHTETTTVDALQRLASILEDLLDPVSQLFKHEEAISTFLGHCERFNVTTIPPLRDINEASHEVDKRVSLKVFDVAREIIVSSYNSYDESMSYKFVILFSLVNTILRTQEKIVIFSQSISSLNTIENFLNNGHIGGKRWKRDRHYYRIDGSTKPKNRQTMISDFNHSSNKVRLFIISTKAGGIGVNLVGASRVILLDSSWNPSHDLQAVARVYRYGQKKKTFIYRLVASGTMESKIYDRQLLKSSLANRVVDDLQQKRLLDLQELAQLLEYKPGNGHPSEKELVECDAIKEDGVLAETILHNQKAICCPPQHHDCFLEDDVLANMTADEIIEAKHEYKKMLDFEASKTYSSCESSDLNRVGATSSSLSAIHTQRHAMAQNIDVSRLLKSVTHQEADTIRKTLSLDPNLSSNVVFPDCTGLPYNWYKAFDLKSYRIYYFNSVTQASVWYLSSIK